MSQSRTPQKRRRTIRSTRVAGHERHTLIRRETQTGMHENRNQSPEPFQFSLRTLMLMVAACGVLFSAFRMGHMEGVFALGLLCFVIATIVAAWARRETHVVDGMLLVYVVAMFLFLVSFFLGKR